MQRLLLQSQRYQTQTCLSEININVQKNGMKMKLTYRTVKQLLLLLTIVVVNVNAQDVYNSANNQLTIPIVTVGNINYSNVVVTVGNIVSVGGNSAVGAGYPVYKAMASVFANGYSKNMVIRGTEVVGGNLTYNLTGNETLTLAPAYQTTFNGVVAYANKTTNTGTLTGQGAPQVISSVGTTYKDAQNQTIGMDGQGLYCVATSSAPYPATISVNQSGLLLNMNCYSDISRASFIATANVIYSAIINNGNLTMQIISNIFDPKNVLLSSTTSFYNINQFGSAVFAGYQQTQYIQATGVYAQTTYNINSQ